MYQQHTSPPCSLSGGPTQTEKSVARSQLEATRQFVSRDLTGETSQTKVSQILIQTDFVLSLNLM